MKVLVGDFNEKQLIAGEDKTAINKAMEETGLKYPISKIIKIKGENYLRLWVGDVYEI